MWKSTTITTKAMIPTTLEDVKEELAKNQKDAGVSEESTF